MSKWLDPHWYRYLFARPADDTPWRVAIWCRLRNHPHGYVWYSPSGMEPDYRCRNCGDYLA